RKSLPGTLYSSMPIPHAGSATRSGIMLGRGFVRVGRFEPDAEVASAVAVDVQHWYVDTTRLNDAAESAGAIANNCRDAAVTCTCTAYVPSGPENRICDRSRAPTAHP